MKNYFFVFLNLACLVSAMADDEVIYQGDGRRVLVCKGVSYDQHFLEIKLMENNKSVISDGIKIGRCLEMIRTNDYLSPEYNRSFQNIELLQKLASEEVIKLFSSVRVGRCKLQSDYSLSVVDADGNIIPSASADRFNGHSEKLIQNLRSKGVDSKTSPEYAQQLLGLVEKQFCYELSEEITPENEIESHKILSNLNLGISYFANEKAESPLTLFKMGFSIKTIRDHFSYDIESLVDIGFTPAQIIKYGEFETKELKGVFTIEELRDSDVSVGLLKHAGFRIEEIKGIGYSFPEIDYEFSSAEMKAHYSIADFKANNYGVGDLKSIGYSIKEIQDAGYTFEQIDYEYSSSEMKAVYSIRDLKQKGYSVGTLKSMGFSIQDIKAVGYTFEQIDYEYSSSEMKAVYAIGDFKEKGYSVGALKSMGYSQQAIKDSGFTFAQMDYEYSSLEMKQIYSLVELKANGYSVATLKNMGYTIQQLKDVGFTFAQLDYEYSNMEMKSAYSLRELKEQNYNVASLKGMGFTILELKAVGFTFSQLDYEYSSLEMKGAYTLQDFKLNNYSVSTIKTMGYTIQEVFAAGFTKAELRYGGYSNSEIDAL